MFNIRDFKLDDVEEIYHLFYETVHSVNARDYTEEQLNMWAPKTPDIESWSDSLSKNLAFVAVKDDTNEIVGFADLRHDGYFDRAYVHKDYQGCGIGRALMLVGEKRAKELGIKELHSDVSITAKPFVEKLGYTVEKKSIRVKSNVQFTVFRMRKMLGS